MKDKLKKTAIIITGVVFFALTIITFLIMFKVIPVPEGLYGLVVLRG